MSVHEMISPIEAEMRIIHSDFHPAALKHCNCIEFGCVAVTVIRTH